MEKNNSVLDFPSYSTIYEFGNHTYGIICDTRGVCVSATTKTRRVILDFDMVSEIITFEQKGRFGKEKHQNLGVKVKVIA